MLPQGGDKYSRLQNEKYNDAEIRKYPYKMLQYNADSSYMVGDISWVASRRITYHILQASWYHVTQTKELVAIFCNALHFQRHSQ